MHTIFAPHGMCMMWNRNLILLDVLSDGLVALSYYSIPAALLALTLKKRNAVPLRPLVMLFALFILFCGTGHVLDIVSIWKPVYWLKAYWNTGTALTSVVTAIVLIPNVAGFLKLPETTAQLERENGVLQSVLNAVPEGILLTVPTGRVVACNPAAVAILGAGVGSSWTAAAGETRIGGRTVEHSKQDVSGLGSVHVLHDVTEKRRNEEQRMRLERAIATMRQGFAIVPLTDNRLEAANPAMEQIFGGPVNGIRLTDIFAGSGEERLATYLAIQEAADVEGYWEGETVCKQRDGAAFDSLLRVNMHQGERGTFLSLLVQDISAQKRMQREAEELQAKLAQAQKLETLGVLAGGVAHDFNNLLTGIMGNASLAAHLTSIEEIRGCLTDVVTASERAADLIQKLLAYAGKGQLGMGPVDLNHLARETHKLVRATIPRNVEIRMYLQEGLPLMMGDAGQIEPILMNLIINAGEAIGEKAGVVEIRTFERELDDENGEVNQLGDLLPPGRYVGLEVRDNGCGMTEETLAHIFDPFYTTKFTGRGLGLSAVSGIVRSHRGNVRVVSEVGKGSTFRVLFPATMSEPAPERPAQAAEAALQGAATVLVVDDEEMVRKTALASLRHYGYEVLMAENGKRALEVLERAADRVGVVLLDMTMPVMSGAETLREIREKWPEMPVILTSGYAQEEALRRFEGPGLAGFVQKPFTAQDLAETVTGAAKGSREPTASSR